MPDGTHSPLSFGDILAEVFTPDASVHANAAAALRELVEKPYISSGLRLALKREIVALDADAERARRNRGLAGHYEPRKPATMEAIVAEATAFDAGLTAIHASPEGRARKVIARACAECAERNLPRIYTAFEDVANCLSRGDGDPLIWVDRLQGTLAAMDGAEVDDLRVMATSLRVILSERGA